MPRLAAAEGTNTALVWRPARRAAKRFLVRAPLAAIPEGSARRLFCLVFMEIIASRLPNDSRLIFIVQCLFGSQYLPIAGDGRATRTGRLYLSSTRIGTPFLDSRTSLQSADRASTEEFIEWRCSEPRLALNRASVLRYRLQIARRPAALPFPSARRSPATGV